jgi:L,D-transpeptidase ErfK/SrfK
LFSLIFPSCVCRLSRRTFRSSLLLLCWLLAVTGADARTYKLPGLGTQLVGEVQVVTARESDTLMDIAREHGVGHREIRAANPALNIWVPREGTRVTIPSQYLLPDAPREGIVLNRSEMRLYYYHQDIGSGELLVTTHPVGIGRDDRQTPLGKGTVTMKLDKPAWYPTQNVRADYAARGQTLPAMVPAGPDNPLGEHAMVLDIPGLLIHGTNRPDGVGMLVSQGCIRLYPEAIAALIREVPVGTPVKIVDQATKVGLVDGDLLVEVHPPVYPQGEQDGEGAAATEQALTAQVNQLLRREQGQLEGWVDWDVLRDVARRADGIPVVVSRR